MTELSEIVPLIDEKWDSDSKQMVSDRNWLVDKACERIMEMCKKNINKLLENDEHLPDEIEFQWFNVKNDLLDYLCRKKIDNKMKYSLDTIFDGGITNEFGKINRQRLRDAGVNNPMVLDVKRAIANKCIKIWDVSDKKVSKKNVWNVTIFVHEIRKLDKKVEDEF